MCVRGNITYVGIYDVCLNFNIHLYACVGGVVFVCGCLSFFVYVFVYIYVCVCVGVGGCLSLYMHCVLIYISVIVRAYISMDAKQTFPILERGKS